MSIRTMTVGLLLCGLVLASPAQGQLAGEKPIEKWVDVTGRAAGADAKAKEEATAKALRAAVEEGCGVFLTAQSKTKDYKTVYDKVIANTVGYVKERKEISSTVEQDVTTVKLRVLVSTRKFEEDWAAIAHTLEQENNPRVIVAVVEAVRDTAAGPTYEAKENGIVQGKLEDFFLSKGLTLMDRSTAAGTARRDVMLAALKDDVKELAAMGARFHADVLIIGQASAKYGKSLEIGGQTMYQYVATLSVRVIQADSAAVLASKSFDPVTVTTLQRGGGEDKALAKLGEEYAPKLLAATVEAWSKRANVLRTVQIQINGMDFEAWKTFKEEAATLEGVQALRLREITENVASIDVEFKFTNELLAERLTQLKKTGLVIVELSANRLKFKVKS